MTPLLRKKLPGGVAGRNSFPPLVWIRLPSKHCYFIQIKACADKYRALGLLVSLIGVEFSRESRNVVGFEVAQLGA
jgi:hypothetical protein